MFSFPGEEEEKQILIVMEDRIQSHTSNIELLQEKIYDLAFYHLAILPKYINQISKKEEESCLMVFNFQLKLITSLDTLILIVVELMTNGISLSIFNRWMFFCSVIVILMLTEHH